MWGEKFDMGREGRCRARVKGSGTDDKSHI